MRNVPAQQAYCAILQEGLICFNRSQSIDLPKAYLLWQPGDLMGCENIFGVENSLASLYHRTHLADGAYSMFPAQVFHDRFLQSPSFALHLFNTLFRTHQHQTTFLLGTQLHDARSALIYLLLYCQENNLPFLTHEDFAYLANLNRTTVTKTLKKILLEEDLSISLRNYILSMYEDG